MDEFKIRVVPRPWNKGKLVGQKAPLKLKEIWAIRVRLQVFRRTRELTLFNLGIDSKLRACDLLKLRVRDISHGERIAARAIVVQQKTSRPVQFEITELTRGALAEWIRLSGLASDDFLFPSRVHASIVCVKFSKWRSWVGWLCGLAEVGFLVLLKIAHVEVAVGFEPVFVGLDG